MTKDPREAIDEVLSDMHASMWGRAFDISRPKGREAAIDFIMDLMQSIEKKMFPVVVTNPPTKCPNAPGPCNCTGQCLGIVPGQGAYVQVSSEATHPALLAALEANPTMQAPIRVPARD